MEKWAILGASRGLGAAFTLQAAKERSLLLVARREATLQELAVQISSPCRIHSADFTKESDQILQLLSEYRPERIFYFAGGGPYGLFKDKEWKDHLWALRLSFLFPAQLLHTGWNWDFVKQWTFVGSSVAEDEADPQASSYSAAKHGLLGLLKSLKAESSDKDLRLFSPGYMETGLIPANAKVRQLGSLWPPALVAEEMLEWVLQPKSDSWHKSLTRFYNSPEKN